MAIDLENLTIAHASRDLANGVYTAEELTRALFNHIETTDKTVQAYLSLYKDEALAEARASDERRKAGTNLGPLDGIPMAIKDNILIEGRSATAASKILEHYIASYDATVISKLKAAGVVFLGKTNMDEFAMGSSTENSGFHVTHHPLDHDRVPGGSSGGSVAAVAANMALGALGTDTGGSVRQPAALCGVVSLKPTYGAVSRSGMMAMAASLNQVGPIAKTVEDTEMLFNTVRGRDTLDAMSTDESHGGDAQQLTIGIPEEYLGDGMSDEVRAGFTAARERFEKLGYAVKNISLPHTKYALACYYIIMPAEISTDLSRFDGIRYARRPEVQDAKRLIDIYLKQRGVGFGPEVKRRIVLGTFVLSSGYYDAYYAKAQAVRKMLKQDFAEAFKEVDVILAPVTPTTACKIGEKTDDPLAMYLADIYTITMNLVGVPSLAMPIEPFMNHVYSKEHLPVGFQLIGKWFYEPDLFALGKQYEAAYTKASGATS
jgi:aspartyl-tRNA(Asn)/glutamyl-tRNA(Gln) amidotransferase subunit A